MPKFKMVDLWEHHYEVEADTLEEAYAAASQVLAPPMSEMAFMGTELMEEVDG